MLALCYSTVLILAFACAAQTVCQELEQDRTPPAQPLLSAPQQPELGVLLDESEQVHLLLLESIVSAWDGIVEQQDHQPQEEGHTGTANVPINSFNVLHNDATAQSHERPVSELPSTLPSRAAPVTALQVSAPSDTADKIALAGQQWREATSGIHSLVRDVSEAVSQAAATASPAESPSRAALLGFWPNLSGRARSEAHQQQGASPETAGGRTCSSTVTSTSQLSPVPKQRSSPSWTLCPPAGGRPSFQPRVLVTTPARPVEQPRVLVTTRARGPHTSPETSLQQVLQ